MPGFTFKRDPAASFARAEHNVFRAHNSKRAQRAAQLNMNRERAAEATREKYAALQRRIKNGIGALASKAGKAASNLGGAAAYGGKAALGALKSAAGVTGELAGILGRGAFGALGAATRKASDLVGAIASKISAVKPGLKEAGRQAFFGKINVSNNNRKKAKEMNININSKSGDDLKKALATVRGVNASNIHRSGGLRSLFQAAKDATRKAAQLAKTGIKDFFLGKVEMSNDERETLRKNWGITNFSGTSAKRILAGMRGSTGVYRQGGVKGRLANFFNPLRYGSHAAALEAEQERADKALDKLREASTAIKSNKPAEAGQALAQAAKKGFFGRISNAARGAAGAFGRFFTRKASGESETTPLLPISQSRKNNNLPKAMFEGSSNFNARILRNRNNLKGMKGNPAENRVSSNLRVVRG